MAVCTCNNEGRGDLHLPAGTLYLRPRPAAASWRATWMRGAGQERSQHQRFEWEWVKSQFATTSREKVLVERKEHARIRLWLDLFSSFYLAASIIRTSQYGQHRPRRQGNMQPAWSPGSG